MNLVSKVLLYTSISLLSIACTPLNVEDESSYFFDIPVGSRLHLHETLEIAPDQVSVYMQHGQLQDLQLIDRYKPYCKFEVYTIAEIVREVEPDTFTIVKVIDDIEMTALLPIPPLASFGSGHHFGFVSDQPAVYTYATYIDLRSDKQPDVYRMTCMHWESIMDDHYLTVPQMREAMGELFTLQLAD